jgi:hypothetical protein
VGNPQVVDEVLYTPGTVPKSCADLRRAKRGHAWHARRDDGTSATRTVRRFRIRPPRVSNVGDPSPVSRHVWGLTNVLQYSDSDLTTFSLLDRTIGVYSRCNLENE